MTTFVLLVFFWESARGYSITNVPGYESRAACETAGAELKRYNDWHHVRWQCIPGPSR